MDEISLYIEVSTEQVRKCRRRYLYIVEYARDGVPLRTGTYTGQGENVSLERAVLTAAVRGIGRIRGPGRVRIYTGGRDILAPLRNGAFRQWERNGFRNSRGEPVRNADLWGQANGMLEGRAWDSGCGAHLYRDLMRYSLGKMEEKYGKTCGAGKADAPPGKKRAPETDPVQGGTEDGKEA